MEVKIIGRYIAKNLPKCHLTAPLQLSPGNAQPSCYPKLSRFWGHDRKFTLAQLRSSLGQTSADQTWPHPNSAASQPAVFTPALSQEKQKEPPGEDPILQLTL